MLLIFDEIATGFGRTGELFAAEHAGVSPDIMCVGKAITGGYITLAATLCSREHRAHHQHARARRADARPDVHGQRAGVCGGGGVGRAAAGTGLAVTGCARSRRACATGLAPAAALPGVADVRVLGAIGVIEMDRPVDLRRRDAGRAASVACGCGRSATSIYVMPPYICTPEEIEQITSAMVGVAACVNLNTVQVRFVEGQSVTRVGLSPLAWLDEVEQQRRAAGLRRSLRTRPPVGAELDLASNDYLGLSQHPEVIDGGVEALRTWGAGSTGSRLVTGNTELHEGFEAALADFVGAESALVFSSGYTANLGAVVALSGPGSLLVSDALTHASLVDACRLSRARVVVTPHRDVAAVEAALAAPRRGARGRRHRLGVQRGRRAGAAARAARRVPSARRTADRRRGARARGAGDRRARDCCTRSGWPARPTW